MVLREIVIYSYILLNFPSENEWSFKSIERIKYLSKTHAGMLGVFGLSAWGWSKYGRVWVVVHSIAIVISIVPIRRVRVIIVIYRVVSRRAPSFSWNQTPGPWGYFNGCIQYLISICDLIRLKHQLLISKSTSLKHAGNILPVSAIFKLYKDDKNYWLLWSLRSHSIRKNYHHSNFRTSSVCEVLRSLDACCNSLVAILLIYHSPKFWNLLASGNDNRYFNLFTQTIELHINHWDGDHFQEPKYNLDKDFR